MCVYCKRKLKLDEQGQFNRNENSVIITDGRCINLRAGIDKENHLVLFAQSDINDTEDFLPMYCPWCGRQLYYVNDKGEWVFNK